MTDLDGRSSSASRRAPAASAGADRANARVNEPPRPRRVRSSGNRYDVSLKHSDPTSLDPLYIVRTGQPVDDEPGRTSRLAWTKGRRRPISDREAYNVFWRRRAARLKRLYADPDKQEARRHLPATLEEAIAAIPPELPAWGETRSALKMQLPARLTALANAYADIQQCSLPQLVELALYEMITADVRKPSEFKAAYDRMRKETYQEEREQRRLAETEDDYDDE